MGRQRVDKLVVERGITPTREKARRLILAGEVLVDDTLVDKPGTLVSDDANLRLRHPLKPYVGRGGEKLEGALETFGLDVTGLHVLDVGASTGGFTDCLLQRGAATVTALDVGRGQLAWKLYSDSRVHVIEGVNARYLKPDDFAEPFELIVVDVSFISLTKVLPALARLLRPGGRIVMLVKPQFELGPEHVERGGLVREPRKQEQAIASVKDAAKALGLAAVSVEPAAITGASGNQEFFLLVRSDEE